MLILHTIALLIASGTDPTPTITGLTGGAFTSTASLSIGSRWNH